jgi:hypothetical protein
MTSIFDKLAGFISGRGGEGRATKGKLSDFLTENSRVINQVVNDIFRPYLDPKTKKPHDIKQILSLMDIDTCSQMMIFLSNTLEANLTRYNVGSLGSSLTVLNDPNSCPKGGNCSRALNEKTIEIKPGVKISKRDMCDTIAIHYVKLLNLIGSILVAINPDTNMCLARFNNLYTLIETEDEGQAFQVGICAESNKHVIRQSLLKEPGLAELLQLYLYHLVKQTETEADKQAVIREYANLVALFEEEGVIEPGEERTNNKSQNVNNQQKQNIPPIMNNAEHGLVPELLEQEQEQEQQPQQQEQPSENLSAAIRRLENRFQELETSQRANRNTKRAARNSELKAEIAELKATISNLTALVKQGKATPANVSQTINTGTQTSARNISAATFNTNESATKSLASKNVNQMNTYNNSDVTNSYRDWGYGAVNNPNNSEQDSSRKLERLEGRLVKLLKKLNNNKNSQNSTRSANSSGSSRASGYEYEAPESMTSEYTDYESNGGSSQAYNKSIQTGGSPNSINASTPENTNTIFGYSNKPNMENQSLGLENAVPNMDTLQPTENAGQELMKNEPSERTQEFMTASASLDRFRSFMKEYIEDKPDVRNMFLKVFNAKFKAPRKEKIDRICTNAKSKGQLFTVNVSEASENSDVKAFVDNYSAMKSEYMEACGRLVDILENRILEQVPDTEPRILEQVPDASESQETNEAKPMRYILRDLTGAELKEIETLTRTTLAELYGKCHRRYLEGINHLDSYFFNKTKRMNVMVS